LDTLLFATLLLYSRFTSTRDAGYSKVWQQAMKQDSHSTVPLPGLMTLTQKYFQLLSTLASRLLQLTDTVVTINNLLRIIQYNSQSFSIPELPNTSLMCHFNSLSKLNHSCVPNAILSLSLPSPTASTLKQKASGAALKEKSSEKDVRNGTATATATAAVGSIVTLRDIQPGEELCVSYVSQLCTSVEHRQTLLQQGFLFTCYCPRCLLEQSILMSSSDAAMTSPSFDFSTLDLANYHHIVNQLKSIPQTTQQLKIIEQEHTRHLQRGLTTLFALQKKLTTSSAATSPLNKTIVQNVYLLHDAVLSLLNIAMGLKVSARTPTEAILWDVLAIQLIDMLCQCWELSHSSVQFFQISFFFSCCHFGSKTDFKYKK
jgi:hypothetical protein